MKVSSNDLAVIRPTTSFIATLTFSTEFMVHLLERLPSQAQAQHMAPFLNPVDHEEKDMRLTDSLTFCEM